MRPGRAADHSPPSSAAVMEEYSYTSTHPLGHTVHVTGSLYLFHYSMMYCNTIVLTIACSIQYSNMLYRFVA